MPKPLVTVAESTQTVPATGRSTLSPTGSPAKSPLRARPPFRSPSTAPLCRPLPPPAPLLDDSGFPHLLHRRNPTRRALLRLPLIARHPPEPHCLRSPPVASSSPSPIDRTGTPPLMPGSCPGLSPPALTENVARLGRLHRFQASSPPNCPNISLSAFLSTKTDKKCHGEDLSASSSPGHLSARNRCHHRHPGHIVGPPRRLRLYLTISPLPHLLQHRNPTTGPSSGPLSNPQHRLPRYPSLPISSTATMPPLPPAADE